MLSFLKELKKKMEDKEDLRKLIEIERTLQEKKYGLIWEEHKEKTDEILEKNIPILREIEDKKLTNPEKSGGVQSFNYLIEGDNLHSLKILEKTHRGKIDVIYIDPPYNTGNRDFIYDDNYVDKNDGYRHSKWLSFINKRLQIAKKLLKDEGVVFISIDDNEQSHLKVLCDEIFGEKNKLGVLTIINNLKGRSDDNFFATCNEYLLVYSKNKEKSTIKGKNLEEEEIEKEYKKEDFFGKYKLVGLRKTGKESKREDRPYSYYPILLKNSEYNLIGEEEYRKIYNSATKEFDDSYVSELKIKYEKLGYDFILPVDKNLKNGRWRWGIETFNKNKKTELELNSSGTLCSKQRLNLENNAERLKTNKTTWYKSTYDTGSAGKLLKNILRVNNIDDIFDNPKSLILLKDIVDLSFNKNAIVLDFFAGSGTTGHAVAQLNKEDGGNRKYILCTNNENNICEEVTYKRLKNIQKELPHNLKYLKTDYIPKISKDEDDLSIRKKVEKNIKELIELENHIEIDNQKYIIAESEEKMEEDINRIEKNGILFLPPGIFLSRTEQRKLDEKNIKLVNIPEYYFRNELREAGEI